MEWISKCVSSLYSNDCPSDCKKSCLPPIVSDPLPDIEPTRDCLGCDKPCGLHPVVPPNLNIDQSRPLYNTVPAYAIHIIILTGKADWPAHIEDDGVAKALIEAINVRKKKVSMFERSENDRFHLRSLRASVPDRDSLSQRIIVTNASLSSQYTKQRNACDVLLMPDNVIISNITPRRANAFIDFVCGKPSDQFTVRPSPFTNLLLVCGHARKDRRCGTLGPMLQTALTTAMDNAGVPGQVALCSHLGGKNIWRGFFSAKTEYLYIY